ncbi:MAG: hypothetical protein WCO19_02185 [Candidatus Saccharibacteria bacterium]
MMTLSGGLPMTECYRPESQPVFEVVEQAQLQATLESIETSEHVYPDLPQLYGLVSQEAEHLFGREARGVFERVEPTVLGQLKATQAILSKIPNYPDLSDVTPQRMTTRLQRLRAPRGVRGQSASYDELLNGLDAEFDAVKMTLMQRNDPIYQMLVQMRSVDQNFSKRNFRTLERNILTVFSYDDLKAQMDCAIARINGRHILDMADQKM